MTKSSLAIALLLNLVSLDQANSLRMNSESTQCLSEHASGESLAQSIHKSCTASVERFVNGTSNSWATFKNAHHASSSFKDPEFPADDSSLFWDKSQWGREEAQYTPPAGLQWQRPGQIANGNRPSIYGTTGKPQPNGVRQMNLGDCWFLAAASAVAETPERIHKILWNKHYPTNGAFRFYFWVKDGWMAVNIDDRLPVQGGRLWATQQSQQNAWWMPLLEKAYAKLDVNYDNIIAGWGQEGLRTLTGMPTINLNLSSDQKSTLYPIHKYFAEKNYPMTSGCCRNGGVHGLITGHAYSLLDVTELKDANGIVAHTLAKLRNPWNSEHYTGPWRDDDPNWTTDYKQQVNLQPNNDGIFWMDYDTYLKYWYNTGVALYDEWRHYELKKLHLPAGDGYKIFKIKQNVAQHFQITGETYSRRHYPRTQNCSPFPDRQKSGTVFYLLDEQWNTIAPGQIGDTGFATVGTMAEELPAGTYMLYIYVADENIAVDISLNFYAMKELPTMEKYQ